MSLFRCNNFVHDFLHLSDLLIIIILISFILSSQSFARTTNQITAVNDRLLDSERALNRTLTKLHNDGEEGRLVVLICRGKCMKERTLVPKWIREFNEVSTGANDSIITESVAATEDELDDAIGYHFHFYRLRFGAFGVDKLMRRWTTVLLLYVVGGQSFHLASTPSEAITKERFVEWLRRFEHPPIAMITNDHPEQGGGIDEWLNNNCTATTANPKHNGARSGQLRGLKVLIFIHHMVKCRDYLLKNIARSFSTSNVSVVELRRPFSEETEVSLYWRMPSLSQKCRMLVLLVGCCFIELDNDISPLQLHAIVAKWKDVGNCTTQIGPPLGPIQLEYLREEFQLKGIEHNRLYILVGLIGGIAVIALAMSIFWGLNGNAFVGA